ncbi:AI-2E family transporter [Salidesulfovibrio brasiliensis]|uniref:AI-2E family transporter n=1 Tax=Salidesulfovibrio brasiliensis TaxID=221711 RepID=UPI0006D0F1FF|nr:AI-2E family transporter [Salidesulfovibrio brasiliensis]
MSTQNNNSQGSWSIYSATLLVLLATALYLGYSLVEAFLHSLLLSCVLAIMSSPVMYKALELTGGRRNWAAVLTTLTIVVVLLIPMVVVIIALVNQGIESVAAINKWIRVTDFDHLMASSGVQGVLHWVHDKLPFLDLNGVEVRDRVLDFSRDFAQTMLSYSTVFVRDAFRLLLLFLLMVFALFYFLRDGTQMVEFIKQVSPLRTRQEDYIIDSLKRVSRGVLMGCLLVAVLQGLVGGVGLAICGIPGVFWGAMTAFCSLVPVVGTGIIWVPAAIYLFITGQWQLGVFLTLWFSLIVVSIDTFLRPYFMREAAQVSTFYIFLAILGGISAFGMLGILYGPLILSFLMVMLQIYTEEYGDSLKKKESD